MQLIPPNQITGENFTQHFPHRTSPLPRRSLDPPSPPFPPSPRAACPNSTPEQSLPRAALLTFGFEVPVEGAVLGKAAPALVALERLLSGVVADVAHQGALLPEPPAAELAHVGLVLQVGTEMHLLGVLHAQGGKGRAQKGHGKLMDAGFNFQGGTQCLL